MPPRDLDPLPESHFKDFFEKFGTLRSAEVLFREWLKQTESPRLNEFSRRCRAIALAADVAEITVRNAFHDKPSRRAKVGAEKLQSISLMAQFLRLPTDPLPPGKRNGSIVLLTDFNVLSVRFHFDVTRFLTCEAAKNALALSLHECPRHEMVDKITGLLARHDFDAFLFLRLTPTKAALEVLKQTYTPVVLIHADVLQYQPPVIAHVVPDQSDIPGGIARWLAVLKRVQKRKEQPKVVVVAVQDEEPRACDWEPLEAGRSSIRNQRKRLIRDALLQHGAKATMEEVRDYSSYRALDVYQRHPDADGFVCLSDSLAVAMKQHFIVDHQPWQGRILGFDNTELAQEEEISSFEQSRSETARLAIEALMRAFDRTPNGGAISDWPAPQLARVKVSLKLRP